MTTPLSIITVYGTRPEAIKLAPVVLALKADPRFDVCVVNTGQHRDLVKPINQLFGINSDYDLDIMASGQSLSSIAAKIIERLDPLLASQQPDAVVIQGDTNSVFAAALSSFYNRVPIVHVEAGLRSGELANPFPEEANRRLVSQISSLHLAPTERNRDNLLNEGVPGSSIVVTGNTVIDALQLAVQKKVQPQYGPLVSALASTQKKVLVTTHRRENWGHAMRNIGEALHQLADRHKDTIFIWPAHPNPTIKNTILPKVKNNKNVIVCDPLNYGEFTTVMSRCSVVLTDSGGIQEEAPALNIPVIVMRNNTERTEGVAAGTLILAGTSSKKVIGTVDRLLENDDERRRIGQAINPYGDGKATARSLEAIYKHFS